jgi:signal transduction histidine kinase
MERVFSLLSSSAEHARVKLELALPALPRVSGDEDQLQQVMMNLVLNAIEAMPGGGSIRASARLDNNCVELVLDDSGPGIPVERRERIFEPFFTTKAQGSGLGLPLVHAILTQHGGSITVNGAPSGGARFIIRLPVSVPG